MVSPEALRLNEILRNAPKAVDMNLGQEQEEGRDHKAPVRCAPRVPAMVWLPAAVCRRSLPGRPPSTVAVPRSRHGGGGRYESPILDPPETLEQ
jgi:hypothetical protein